LRQIIDAKIGGQEVVVPTVEAPPKVVNLMEALRKSLDAVSAQKKKAAKAPEVEEKPVARRKRA
jgi:non-homologous end joining protein Ku